MTRIIGTHTRTIEKDVYDYSKRAWFRVQLMLERELHATKGWRALRKSRRVIPIRYPRDRSFGNVIERQNFKRW